MRREAASPLSPIPADWIFLVPNLHLGTLSVCEGQCNCRGVLRSQVQLGNESPMLESPAASLPALRRVFGGQTADRYGTPRSYTSTRPTPMPLLNPESSA